MSDAGTIVWYSKPNMYGNKFKCSKRTAAHLDRTRARLQKKAKKDRKTYSLTIIQGSYNTGVEASAGTHDYDAVLDVEIVGMTWYDAQRWLRREGWAAWVRTPAQGFSYHIHMISIPKYKYGWVDRVGVYVNGQIDDYYAHRTGLASGGNDNTWFPPIIRRTIFNYNLWELTQAARRQVIKAKKQLSKAKKRLQKLLKRK